MPWERGSVGTWGPVVRSTDSRGLNVQVIWALLSIDRWGQTGMGGSQHRREHEARDLGKSLLVGIMKVGMVRFR